MCRLYGFRANEPTKVECSLVYAQNALLSQSRKDHRGKTHSDGWGISYYEDGRPFLEKSPAAAFEGAHFSRAAERAFSRTVIAHVRLATVGDISPENTHPFVWGRWTFAHNGNIAGFSQLETELTREVDPDLRAHRLGQTDSELMFYWLLTRLRPLGIDALSRDLDLDRAKEVFGESVAELAARSAATGGEKPPRLTCLLTDGESLLAARWNNSLYRVEREGTHDCELCGIPHIQHQEGTEYRAVVLASEEITEEAWREVPEESVLTVGPDLNASVTSIQQSVSASS